MKFKVIAVVCIFIITTVTQFAHAADRPNVLFIAVDDLNDWIGCLKGHPQALTPNIDELAARGVLFTNAHCAAPACNPSRAAIFSGLMPDKTGVWSNSSGSLSKRYPQAHLLSTAFGEAGYRTFGTGKLLHSGGGKTSFDDYFSTEQRWSPLQRNDVKYTKKELPTKGTSNPRHVTKDRQGHEVILPLNRMPSDRRPNGNDGESFDWGPFDVPDTDFGDTKITNWAIGKVKAGFDKPFFLGVGYYRPHIPLWAPQRFFDRFEKTPAKLPEVMKDDLHDLSKIAKQWAIEPVTAGSHATVVKYNQWQAAVEAYLACTTYVDYEIGRMLKTLDDSMYADSTWIVLWTDHGWHLGEKQHWGKWTGWERSTKVPLIVVPPRKLANQFAKPGSRCAQPVGLIDLYPTLAEACQLKPKYKLDGQSLIPLLRNPNQQTGRTLVTMFDQGNVSLRTERWRFIRYKEGAEELYDLQNDPHEWTNLIESSKHAEVVSQFRTQFTD